MDNVVESKKVRAGSRTYFFDVKKTKAGDKKYLVITESRRDREGMGQMRSRIFVFPEDIKEFIEVLSEIGPKIG